MLPQAPQIWANSFHNPLQANANTAGRSTRTSPSVVLSSVLQIRTKLASIPRHRRIKSWVALALSFAAGFADIVGALTIYDLFTAHISGTSVRLAQHLAERSWRASALAIIIVVAFFLGSLLGRVLIEAAQRRGFKRVASVTLALEVLFLLVVIGFGNWSAAQDALKTFSTIAALLAILAASMGLQTASLTKIGPLTVHTTFVTGMINKLAQLVSLWLFGTHDLHFGYNPKSNENLQREVGKNARQIRFFFSLWLLYSGGAACGTFSAHAHQFNAFYYPCAILLAVVLVDQVRPLSIEEEQEQVE